MSRHPIHQPPCSPRNWQGSKAQTCGVPGVDDAQHLGVTVLFGLLHGPPELVHIQGPAVVLIQVIVHLDGIEFGDDCWVEWVLRDGDHHACPWLATAGDQDLQDCLKQRSHVLQGHCHFPRPGAEQQQKPEDPQTPPFTSHPAPASSTATRGFLNSPESTSPPL